MREILFRGRDVYTGEWVYGGYSLYPHMRFPAKPTIYEVDSGCWHPVEIVPETLGQYTGLIDRMGQRIFEGDVIIARYVNVPIEKCEHVVQVVFRHGKFCVLDDHGKSKVWTPLPDGIPHHIADRSVWMEWCEVIGNIHDNPELIGGAET